MRSQPMPEALLTGLSQVGVAIAGFSGIAVVLIARDDIDWLKTKAITIKAMLETSLTVTVFALLPLTLDYIVADVGIGLARLTTVFGVWTAWIFWLAMRRGRWIWNRQSFGPIVVCSMLVILVLLVVGIGNISEYLWEAYLLGLFWLLVMSMMNFSLLLYSRLEADNE